MMQDINSLISLYTEQIEALDQLTITYLMTCFGATAVIIGVIVSLHSQIGDILEKNKRIQKSMSILFLIIPVIMCVVLGVSVLNFRKVAMYRGYLIYLEELYNKKIGETIYIFNTEGLTYLEKYTFQTNTGSLMNAAVGLISTPIVLLVTIIPFVLSKRCMNNSKIDSRLTKLLYNISLCILIIICLVVLSASIFDLTINNIQPTEIAEMLRNGG